MGGIVGNLAFTNRGIVVLGVAFFYLRSLREGGNSVAVKNVLVEDGSSATPQYAVEKRPTI